MPKKSSGVSGFRVGEGFNTNKSSESFPRIFKYKNLKGILNKRMDKCLLNLIKFNRDKIFERLEKLVKRKYSFRMRYIEESHEASKRMSFNNVEIINETNFKVKSKEGVKLYDVSKINERCAVNSCKIMCPDCELCSHEYIAHALVFYFEQTCGSTLI